MFMRFPWYLVPRLLRVTPIWIALIRKVKSNNYNEIGVIGCLILNVMCLKRCKCLRQSDNLNREKRYELFYFGLYFT